MILYLSQGMTSLALRIKETIHQNQLTDWRCLQLLIQPGEAIQDVCNMGSPWILTGCWPGHRTDVDVANYRHEFPTICYDAYDLDAEGRIVFKFDHRLWSLPPGRYLGSVRTYPQHGHIPWHAPFNLTHDMSRDALPKETIIPLGYNTIGSNCSPQFPESEPLKPEARSCVLARFEIDLGPACHEHVIDQATVEHTIFTCADE